MGKIFQNASSLKSLGQLKPNCPGMIIGRSSTNWRPSWMSDRHKKHIFCRGSSNDHSWAVWFQLSKWFQRRSVLKHFSHRVQCYAFFSETTNIIKAKLYMNVHWMVLYKLYVFCSDMKFKMAATAGLSLTLDPAVVAILNFRLA
jgi:hypothetical protein